LILYKAAKLAHGHFMLGKIKRFRNLYTMTFLGILKP